MMIELLIDGCAKSGVASVENYRKSIECENI